MSRFAGLLLGLAAGTLLGQPAPVRGPAAAPRSTPSDRSYSPAVRPGPAVAPSPGVTVAQPVASVAAPAGPDRAATVEHDGQTFTLANRTAASNVETDEYVVAGEKLADWTQLLTVQRLTLATRAGADEFLAYFQKRVAVEGASVDVVKQSAAAAVFAVRFPKSDRNDEQVMICLALPEPDAARLAIVQYAIKPARAPVSVVEMRLRSWKDQFVRQAQAREPAARQ